MTAWFSAFSRQPCARARLVCFPPAGSSASAFGRWGHALGDDVEVLAVEYPGRGSRRGEPPFYRLNALVASLARSFRANPPGAPYVFLGHSLGALVAFELVRLLARRGVPAPAALFALGCRAPSLPPARSPSYALPDNDFVDELRRLNGTDSALLSDPVALRLFLPALRADFEVAETYVYRTSAPLSVPVFAYGGKEDPETPAEDLDAWRLESRLPLTIRLYPGDHFFVRAVERVATDVASDMRSLKYETSAQGTRHAG